MTPFAVRSKQFFIRQILLSLSLSMVLAGCATLEDDTTDAAQNEQPLQSTNPLKTSVENVLERPLDAETMALLLEAEIAAYRGNLEKALAIYAQLAQRSMDPGIAKRYAEVAAASDDIYVLLDAALLWYELEPEDEVAQQLSIRALARMGETEGAWEIIMRNSDNHLAVRILAAETRRAEYGIQMLWLYEQIAAFYGVRPNSSELLISLSILSEGVNLIDAALSYAEGASALAPDTVLPIQLQANALIKLEREEDAIGVVSDYALRTTAPEEYRIQMARQLAAISEDAALPVFQSLAEEFPWSADLQLGTAQLLLGLNRTEEAEQYYVRLTRMGEHRDLAHFNLGRIYEQRNLIDQARDYYFLVEPGDLEFESRLRAALLQAQATPLESEREFSALHAKFPDSALTIYHEHGRVFARVNEPEQALRVFSEGLAEFPDNETLLYARSVTYESIDKVDEAVADLRTILALDPENVSAMNALGYTLANRTEHYAEAYDLIERALALNPEDPAIIDSMGWVLHRLGRNNEALEYLERAFDAFFDAEILTHLVEVLVALDRADDARSILAESLDRLPDGDLTDALILRLEELEAQKS